MVWTGAFTPFIRPVLVLALLVALVLGIAGCGSVQRKLLYFPSHQTTSNCLTEWKSGDRLIGFARLVPRPRNVWLLVHGNAGQAADRSYALPSFSADDSVYILEYPGYGRREGSPSLTSINFAAKEAYDLLRAQFPSTPVCIAGESIGTGPACWLTTQGRPPDKLVLIVPFDILAAVAKGHYPFLPVSLLLHDNWNNVEALKGYVGPLEIFAADHDGVIPGKHAQALAASKPQAVFHEFAGGHNSWSHNNRVRIRNP
ncbi:MAG TPA: hypothetical protein VG734_12325 [Lacunisphaera sp.]|nr:hypothetical protein [Lacunisphaera sp.]